MTADLDLIIGFAVVYAIAFAPYIVGAAVLLVLGVVAGTAWDRRRRGGLRDQHRAVAALAVKLATAEGAPARLRDQLFDAQRDLLLAEERAGAYQHRAERDRARADAAAAERDELRARATASAADVHELRLALGRTSEELARVIRIAQGEQDDDPDTCYACGKPMPLAAQRDHLIKEHGVDPVLLVSMVRIPGGEVDPR